MKLQRFRFSTEIPRPAREVFSWHERPGALQRLTPPWAELELLSGSDSIADGQRVRLRQKIGPVSKTWEVEHRGYIEGREFRDVALSGPFAHWEHLHRVLPDGAANCVLIDEIEYALPAAASLGNGYVQQELERTFRFRHQRLADDVRIAGVYGAVRPLRILVSGSSGMVGSALIPFLSVHGHEVVRLVRHKPVKAGEVFWDPEKGELDIHDLKAIDVVINLAGANVSEGRWTQPRRDVLWNSRVKSTHTLAVALEKLRHRPFAFISVSGVGFYGSRGDEEVDENTGKGTGFLADLCDAWEREADYVGELGIRPVLLRTGVVLSPAGGALKKLLPIFRAGLGGAIGSGQQWMSWLSIDDFLGIIYHSILDQRCVHEVNAVTPNAVTNRDFARTLAHVLGRPSVMRVPEFAIRAAYGDMGVETILSSTRAVPHRLLDAGYRYRHEQLETALRYLLGKSGP